MSRPNGPVHRPGTAVPPEHTSDPYASPADPNGGVNYTGQPQAYTQQAPEALSHVQGTQPQPHAPQPQGQPSQLAPHSQSYQPGQAPAYGDSYAQPAYGQDYNTPPHQPAAQAVNPAAPNSVGQNPAGQNSVGMSQDPALSSWADVNQPAPAPQAPQPTNQGYPEAATYAAPPADQTGVGQPMASPQTHALHEQAPQDPAQPTTYDPAYSQYTQPPQAQTPQGQHAQPDLGMPSTTPTVAPAGYDFASYNAPQAPGSLDAGVQPAPTHQNVDWGQGEFAAAGATTPPAPASDDFGLTRQTADLDPHQQPVHVDEAYAGEDDDYEYEDEHAGGRSKGVFIAAALAGAIVVGGGMAYGYQALFGSSGSTKPPVVRGASGPAKVKPADPGGRKFAHTNKKIMGRLGSGSTNTNDPASGARRVSTLRIGRDGSVMAPSNPAAGGNGPRMVTGMTLGGADTGVAATTPKAVVAKAEAVAGDAKRIAAANKPIVVNPPATNTPVQIAKVKPAVAPAAAPPVVTTKSQPVAQPKPQPKKVAIATPSQPVATGPKPTGAGYVAVLASVPVSNTSRMDALKQFANMQQKYGAVLQNKTPDVQRANLGAKGTYHRLIAGPPGSVQSARSVCAGLKSAGYASCWVLAY